MKNGTHLSEKAKLCKSVYYTQWLFLLAYLLISCSDPKTVGLSLEPDSGDQGYFERKASGLPTEMGQWEPVPMAEDFKARMQSVHTTLLPNGKVLIVNGSSNRNTINESISDNTGADVGKDNAIQDGSNLKSYVAINNMVIFDPEDNSFTKYDVPPVLADTNLSNDLFCSGHLQMADGNVLFAGGTQSYYPGEKFVGSKSMRYWDWSANEWVILEDGADGHWYPSLIEFDNGVVMIISGWSFYKLNQTSTIVEFYNPKRGTWQHFDIGKIKNNPFQTFLPGSQSGVDGIQLYPRMYALDDGRVLITGDGAGWGTNGGDQSKFTYYMNVDFEGEEVVDITFERAPDRKTYNKIYGSSCRDPYTGDVLLFAGQTGPLSQNNNDFGPGPWANGKPDVRVTADFEVFHVPDDTSEQGEWDYYPDYLGSSLEDVRMMHLATLLPSKEILIVNGGNYAYHRPVFFPVLFTKNTEVEGSWGRKQMNQALQPRMYHNTSLLLPDGRVLTSGGNAARGAFRPDHPHYPELNVYKDPSGVYQKFGEGEYGIPAEIWQSEIFSPPYLFIECPRPSLVIDNALPRNETGAYYARFGGTYQMQVDSIASDDSGYFILMKLGSVTHAWDQGQVAVDVDISARDGNTVTVSMPPLRHSNPPGYYMLFYVNGAGKPSVAEIIQLRAAA